MNQEERAYNELRRKLISSNLKPGARLKEEVWAKDIEVNRSAVRQAFSRLMAEGLLTKGTRGGFFVREYSEKELKDLLEVRIILEAGAAELAVQRTSENDIRRLEEVCDHMEMMAENNYTMGFNEADLKFHETLIQSAHNEFLVKIYERANIPLSLDNKPGIPDSDHRLKMKQDAAVHKEMAVALKNGNATALKMLLLKGLER